MGHNLRPQTEDSWDVGMRRGMQLQQMLQPLLQQKRLNDLRKWQLEDYDKRRNDQLADRDSLRTQGLEDFQRDMQLKQAMGQISGIHTTPINQATKDRPASIGAMPVNEGDPKDLMVASPGVFVSPNEMQSGAMDRMMRQAQLDRLLHPPAPQKLNAGEVLVQQGENGNYNELYRAPGKEAEQKTYTLSPGQKVFDANGKEIAGLDPTDKESRPITVAPGSVVVGPDGKEIFRNPLNPAATKQTPGDISFATNVKTFKTKADELKAVVEKYGNVEGGALWSNPTATAKLGALNYQLAIMYAKIVDPDSVAREGEVTAAQKYLIPAGWFTRNSTTKAAIKNMIDTVAEYEKNRTEVKSGATGSSIGGPEHGIGGQGNSDPLGIFQ